MINPVTQILMTRRAEQLNLELQHHEYMWRKGEISFNEYNSKTKWLIGQHYRISQGKEEHFNNNDISKDSEPKGLLGVLFKLLRKTS